MCGPRAENALRPEFLFGGADPRQQQQPRPTALSQQAQGTFRNLPFIYADAVIIQTCPRQAFQHSLVGDDHDDNDACEGA